MATNTIGSGGTYATPALWWASLPSLFSEDEIGQINDTAEIVTTSVTTFSGKSVSVFNAILEAVSGDSFRDNANKLTNALRYNASNGAAWRRNSGSAEMLSLDNAGVIIRNLQLKQDIPYAPAIDVPNLGLGPVFENLIIDSRGDTAAIKIRNATLKNILVQHEGSAGSGVKGIWHASGDSIILNTTVVRAGTATSTSGFTRDYGDVLLINCASAGFANDYVGTYSTDSKNNATDKATIGGTNLGTAAQTSLVMSTEFESVSASTGDWRLKSTSVKLKDNGASTGAQTPPSTDIVGSSRSGNYDIGVWEFSSGGPTTYPISATATGSHSPVVQRSTTLSAMASSVKHNQTIALLKVVLVSLSTFGAHVASAAFTVAIPVVALATAVFRPSVQKQGNLIKSTFGAHVTPTLALTSVIKGITTDIVTNAHVQTIRRSASLNYQVIKSAVATSSLSAFATIQISVTAIVGHVVTLTRLAQLTLFVRNLYDKAVSLSVIAGGPRLYAVIVSTTAVFTGQLASITNRVRRPFSGGAGLGVHMRIKRHFRPWRRR